MLLLQQEKRLGGSQSQGEVEAMLFVRVNLFLLWSEGQHLCIWSWST